MDLKDRIIEAYNRLGTISGTARAANADRGTVRKYLKQVGLYDNRPMYAGRVGSFEQTSRPLPKVGVKRYILTCMQNNTKVNQQVWDNILALADHYNAEVMVATFSYNKSSYGSKATKKGRGPSASDNAEVWYDPEVDDTYICDDQVEIAPGLVWCGEMNILPTAVKPLSGLEVYTERKSGIFPHVKVAMQSIASGKNEATKFNYTTGTITKRNYIQKKEGLKADFHHIYGGLIVEVDTKGNWFVRQLNADKRSVIYDLDLKVDDGEVTKGHRVEAINWGDIHVAMLDHDIAALAWGDKGMMNTLQPKFQVMNDLLDFRARNGHTAKRRLIHDRFEAYIMGHDSVEEELGAVASFLNWTDRDFCKTIVVDSNHDRFMMEWLRIGDYRDDPVNAIYFLEAQLHVYKSIADNPRKFVNLLRWAMDRIGALRDNLCFLDEDESFLIKDIENGMHGDRGPNGARGTAGNMARLGRRVNRGHEHSAGIFEGTYTAGLTGKNDQIYNVGPSSWSPSHIVTYANGKRAIYTMWGGKWRA